MNFSGAGRDGRSVHCPKNDAFGKGFHALPTTRPAARAGAPGGARFCGELLNQTNPDGKYGHRRDWIITARVVNPLRTALVCSLLLALFAALAWGAVRGKSPTYDEPLHVLAAWLQLHHGDFRLDPENPPLWNDWAGLANGRDAINPRP